MSGHPREHEELLAALLAGERRETEPEVARLLAECAHCRERREHLGEPAARLARAGAERRAVLAELARVGPVAGEERLLTTLERLADGGTEARRRPRRAYLWLAAAAVVAAVVWLGHGYLGRPEAPTWLGESRFADLSPSGTGASFERFSWRYIGAETPDTFTLSIFEWTDSPGSKAILVLENLKESQWTPSVQQLEKLPARIEWRVEALDEFGDSRGSASAQASR